MDIDPAPPRTVAAFSNFAVAVAVAVLATFVTLGALAQLLNLAWGLWFAEIFVFFALPFVALQASGRSPWRLTGIDSATARGIGFGFLFGIANYFAWAVPLMVLAQKIFPAHIVELFDSSALFQHQTTVETILLVAGVSLAAPLCEEFFFRGFFMRALFQRFEPPAALVATAAIFALFHLDPVGLVARFEMGVLFGLLAWRSGSLWPAVAAHAANNITSSAIYFAFGKAAGESPPWWVPLGLFVIGNVLLVGLIALAAGRLPAPRPASEVSVPRPSWVRLVGPWLLGGLVSVGGLLAVDFSGVRLSLFDVVHPLEAESRHDEALHTLRAQARRGERSFEEYARLRRSLSAEKR